MITGKELKRRDLYLDKLKAFQNMEPVKVVPGIRLCGKSSLLRLMAAYLRESGVEDMQIVEMNFEPHEFDKMTSDELYEYVRSRTVTSTLLGTAGFTAWRFLAFRERGRSGLSSESIRAFSVALQVSSDSLLFGAEQLPEEYILCRLKTLSSEKCEKVVFLLNAIIDCLQ